MRNQQYYGSENLRFIAQVKGKQDEVTTPYSRKEYYKICLYWGKGLIEYAGKEYHLSGVTLFLGAPDMPYSWKDIDKRKAYSVIFTKDFLNFSYSPEGQEKASLFTIGSTPVRYITAEQGMPLEMLFEHMIEGYATDYMYKDDLMRNYINILIHEILRLSPKEQPGSSGPERVVARFMALLEKQFPIHQQDHRLRRRSARDFAEALSVHVNYLNHVVKEVTGKSTTAHITGRIVLEAISLLKHTKRTIAEIGYVLGFDYATYFNNYIKRNTGKTPGELREELGGM